MRTDPSAALGFWRRCVLAGVCALGVVGIVGSGGGGEGSFPSDPTVPAGFVAVVPSAVTVQVGDRVVFTATWSDIENPTFQWSRSSGLGSAYVDIPGANTSSYTLDSATLPDDGSQFRVLVRSSVGPRVAMGALTVSSMPGVVLKDGEFQPSDWVDTPLADPAQGGPTHSAERLATGGHPDAYRHMVHTMTRGPSRLSVFHLYQPATYDPQTQGAIHAIDYSEDSLVPTTSTMPYCVSSNLIAEQGGRRYAAGADSAICPSASWPAAPATRAGLRAADFVLLDGPSCGVLEYCPDFSGSAPPLRFGFVRRARLADGQPADSIEHGIDNWTVTVWRR